MSLLIEVAPQDQSIYYLGQIFGLVGNLLPAKNAPWLMGTLFKFINGIALTLGAFLVVYVVIVGLLATAHEGEFMGKKWSGLWVPLRTVFGIATLFPTASGYCAIQIMFMWVIVQGIGAADTLWNNAIDYIAKAGGPGSSISLDGINDTSVRQNMGNLLPSLICQAQYKQAGAPVMYLAKTIAYYCSGSNNAFCVRSETDMLDIKGRQASNNQYSMGPEGKCGVMTYCNASTNVNDVTSSCVTFQSQFGKPILPGVADPDSLKCKVCKSQQASLQSLVTVYGGVAQKFAETDNAYLNFYSTNKTATPDWIKSYCSSSSPPVSDQMCCVQQADPTPSAPIPPVCTDVFGYLKPAVSANELNTAPYETTVKQLYVGYALPEILGKSNIVESGVDVYLQGIIAAIQSWLSGQTPVLEDWQVEAKIMGGFLPAVIIIKWPVQVRKNWMPERLYLLYPHLI